jgi:large-conductance mechanosensitive channel
MDEKTLQALTTLAEKLGTTAEYLWSVLLKQAPISAATDLVVIAAWVFGVAMWAKFVQRKTTKPAATENDRYPSADWNDDVGVGLAWISVFVSGLIVAIISGACFSSIVAAVFNPEYWALKQILK